MPPDYSYQGRIVHANFIAEPSCCVQLVVGNSQNLHTLAGREVVELYQQRDFLPAGAAPGGPVIDHHHLAQPLRAVTQLLLDIRQGNSLELIQGRIFCRELLVAEKAPRTQAQQADQGQYDGSFHKLQALK